MVQIEELADLLGRSDPRVRRLVENARRFPDSRDSALRILQAMCSRKGVDLADEHIFGVPDELPETGTELGNVLRGDNPVGPYTYSRTELPGNLGVLGGAGTGKSSIVGLLSESWIVNGLSVVVMDLADEYGWLIKRIPAEKLLVVNARTFPMALFQNPEGSCLSDLAWLSQVVGVLREVMYFRDGSCNLLLKTVGDMYRERGVLEGSRNHPMLSEVFVKLRNSKYSSQSRHAGFLESLVNRFHGLLQSFPGMNAKCSLIPKQVLRSSVIVRMADLSPAEIDIFTSFFILWLMAVLQAEICHETRVVLVLEEVHLHASRMKMRRFDLGEPISVRLLRTGRKSGVSVVAVDQTPSEIHGAVLGNVATRIVMRLTNSQCARAIATSMGLDGAQVEQLVELPRRRAIMQTPSTPKPFLLEIVDIPERTRPTSEEMEAREKESLAILDHEFSGVDITQVLLGKEKDSEKTKPDINQVRGDTLKVHARICEKPWELIEERAQALGFDRPREFRARKTLVKLGMIALGDKVGAKWQLYVPTAKGTAWAQSRGFPVYRYKSGIGHEMMLRKVREALGRFCSRISFVSEGKGLGVGRVQPDLLARVRGIDGDSSRRVAIQICCTNTAEYEAKRALELCGIEQIDLVAVIVKNKSKARAIEQKVMGMEERVRTIGDESPGRALTGSRMVRHACLRVVSFENCITPKYNWSWVIG
jgi:hypothetical protein